jgi:hypothetical protein
VGCVSAEEAVKVDDRRIRHRSRHSRAEGGDHSRTGTSTSRMVGPDVMEG